MLCNTAFEINFWAKINIFIYTPKNCIGYCIIDCIEILRRLCFKSAVNLRISVQFRISNAARGGHFVVVRRHFGHSRLGCRSTVWKIVCKFKEVGRVFMALWSLCPIVSPVKCAEKCFDVAGRLACGMYANALCVWGA